MLQSIGSQLAAQAPLMAAYLIGILVAALLAKKCPKSAALVIAALLVMFLNIVLGTVISTSLVRTDALEPQQIRTVRWVIYFLRMAIEGVAMAAIVAAVFIGRGRK